MAGRGIQTRAEIRGAAVCLLLLVLFVTGAQAEKNNLPGPLRDVGFEQKLGEPLPLDLVFTNSEGEQVTLGSYFQDRPVILALVYYECPMLCNMVLNGLISSLDILTFDPGDEYEVVVISFDPNETAPLAAAKKTNYMSQFARPGTEEGFHFLVGGQAEIDALTEAVGFSYVYDEEEDEYAHASGITITTPMGQISRYLFGIEYAPKDLRLALVESGQNKIGGAVEQLLLFCYSYDPSVGKYSLAAMNLIRLGGGLTIVGIVGFIVLSRRRDQRLTKLSSKDSASS